MPKAAISLAVLLVMMALAGGVLAQESSQDCVNTVTVWDNDTLSRIAARENVQASELAQLNNLPLDARLRIGQVLCTDGLVPAQPMPQGDTNDDDAESDNNGTGGPLPAEGEIPSGNFFRDQAPSLYPGWRTHTVGDDDTLFGISRRYDASITQIAQANNIDNWQVIFLGETLLIPPGEGAPPPADDAAEDAEPPATGGGTPPQTGVHRPAPDTIPTLSITPRTAGPGDTVTVSGSNYPGNTEVTFYLEKQSQGLMSAAFDTTRTQADGTFTTTLTIPTAWDGSAPLTQPTISISGYAATGGYWAMNYFVNSNR